MKAEATRLSALTRELWNQWQQTKQFWSDSRSQEFERKYLSDLVANVDRTISTIEDLDKLISRIRRECE